MTTEQNIKSFVERHKIGRKTLYDEDKHVELLYKVFLRGGTVRMYCRAAMIGRTTFNDWLKRHRPFRTAYEEAKDLAQAYFEEMALNPPENFNYSVWLHSMKVRFKEPHERLIEVKMPKNKEIASDEHLVKVYYKLLQECFKGKITPREFTEIVSGLRDGLVINEFGVVRKEVNELKANIKGNTRT